MDQLVSSMLVVMSPSRPLGATPTVAVAVALVLLVACAPRKGGKEGLPRQVAFERSRWLAAASFTNGVPNDRTRMKESAMKNLSKGDRLVRVLDLLGTPDRVYSPQDFGPAEVTSFRPGEVLQVAFTVFVSNDNWPDDINFQIDPSGKVVRVFEAYE